MGFLRKAWQIKQPALWLALVRIIIGYEWLKAGWEKVVDPEFAAKMGGALAFFAKDNPNGWYVDFLNAVAVPNSALFATLVAYGQILVGLSLILGLFGAAGAFFGLLMNINFFFAASHLSPSTYGINVIMALIQVILILGGASQAFGLDQLLYDRLPRLFPWWPERAPEPAGG